MTTRALTTRPFRTSPFDVLFKNFFDNDEFFKPIIDTKISHPVDIYENEIGLNIDIACVGLTRDDLTIRVQGDILRINYDKNESTKDVEPEYMSRSIVKRAFNLGWRVSRRFDLDQLDAILENGLLHIEIPIVAEEQIKTINIK